jgi:hypothetical protein
MARPRSRGLRNPVPLGLVALGVMFAGVPSPASASVTVNLSTSMMSFINDGDSGYYVNDGTSSSRALQDGVFAMPVGSDGTPRWRPCTVAPCAKVPTPQSAPGSMGSSAQRSLTPVEKTFITDTFTSGAGAAKPAPEPAPDAATEEAMAPELKALKKAMQETATAASGADPADLTDAFEPLIAALPAARAAAAGNELVTAAETSVKLKNSVSSFSQARNRLTATVAGMKTVSCEMLKRGVADFNRIAGGQAVTYYEQKAPLSLLGLDSCLSQDLLETSMVDYISSELQQAAEAE